MPTTTLAITSSSDIFAGPSAMLSTRALRALGDSKYDKRKSGALEVEGVIKALVAESKRSNVSCEEGVLKVIRRLANDFILSTYSDQRKGGLIGMAAVAVGLGTEEVGKYLDALLPPVLKCFDDPEARVRYFAAEAMYNICKVSRASLLTPPETRFNPVFLGLCKIFSDVDKEVQNGAQLLDRSLKTIVADARVFNLDAVVPLFQNCLKTKNPFVRELLVSWILALDVVPDLSVVRRLPAFLDGLLDMLSDVNKSIRASAERALAVFLKEIAESAPDVRRRHLIPSTYEILVRRRTDQTRAVRATCMLWLGEFINWGGDALVERFADFLKAVIDGVSEQDDTEAGDIVSLARRLDHELQQIARSIPAGKNVNEKSLVRVAVHYMDHPNHSVRETCLQWVSLLLDTVPERFTQALMDELLPSLVGTLSDAADDIVASSLAAMARIARNSSKCDRILGDIITKFESDRKLLEDRGAFIVRKLCVLLRPNTVYLVLARIVDSRMDKDLDFSALMVQTLNVILLTTPELAELRSTLKSAWIPPKTLLVESAGTKQSQRRKLLADAAAAPPPSESKSTQNGNGNGEESSPLIFRDSPQETFAALFKAWSHNSVSALCLCLLSGAYGLAGHLVEILGEAELTVELLVDADRLVRLLESPVFLHLRMQLLKSGKEFEPELLKALYGLLMLLPQKSEAFKALDARLSAITSMHIALGGGGQRAVINAAVREIDESKYDELLDEFTRVQAFHMKRRSEQVFEKSLLS